MAFQAFLLYHSKKKKKDLEGGRFQTLYGMILRYNKLEEKRALLEERRSLAWKIVDEISFLKQGKRSTLFTKDITVKHAKAFSALELDLRQLSSKFKRESREKRQRELRERRRRYRITITPPEEDHEVQFEPFPKIDAQPVKVQLSQLAKRQTLAVPMVSMRRKDKMPTWSKSAPTLVPKRAPRHLHKVEDLAIEDWEITPLPKQPKKERQIDYLAAVVDVGSVVLEKTDATKYVMLHREKWDRYEEPVQYVLNLRRRYPAFFAKEVWPRLRKASDVTSFVKAVQTKGKGPARAKELVGRWWFQAAIAHIVTDPELMYELETAIDDDKFMRNTLVSDLMIRHYREDRRMIDLCEKGNKLMASERKEVLRRLLDVQTALVFQAEYRKGDKTMYTRLGPDRLETLESIGMDVASIQSVGDATYFCITGGWNPSNYLGPALTGMPIEAVFSILTIANLLRNNDELTKKELGLKIGMTGLKLTKTGIDVSRTLEPFKWDKDTPMIQPSAVPVLAGISGSIGIVTGLAETIEARGQWKAAARIGDRYRMVAEHDKKFDSRIGRLPSTSPLRVFRDKIVNGKLGRRKVRALVQGGSGLVGSASGAYTLAIALGATAIPVVGWSLVAAGVLLGAGLIAYKVGRRAAQERAYKQMQKRNLKWYYPKFIKTEGEYYRAVIAAFLHRTLTDPRASEDEIELAFALGWVLFGGAPNAARTAVTKAGVVGIMELLKG